MTSPKQLYNCPRCKNISWKYPFLPPPFVHYFHLTLQSMRSLLSGTSLSISGLGRLFSSARNSNLESKQHLSRNCWVLPNRISHRLSKHIFQDILICPSFCDVTLSFSELERQPLGLRTRSYKNPFRVWILGFSACLCYLALSIHLVTECPILVTSPVRPSIDN